jgi:hypothetical protein
MMTNIRAGEAIDVKYVLNGRKSRHGLLVWKRRRRRQRPGSGPLRRMPDTQTHFRFFDTIGPRVFSVPDQKLMLSVDAASRMRHLGIGCGIRMQHPLLSAYFFL